jgi:hypothetical protein
MERDAEKKQHLFDPFNGADLGETRPRGIRVTDWLVSLHDDLLGGSTGRIVNGVGAILLTLLCVTGAVIWWQGKSKWKRGLGVQWRRGWQRINWDLHGDRFLGLVAVAKFWASAASISSSTSFGMIVDFSEPLDPVGDCAAARRVALEWLMRAALDASPGSRRGRGRSSKSSRPLFVTSAISSGTECSSPRVVPGQAAEPVAVERAKDSSHEQSVGGIRRRRADGRAHGVASAGRGLRAVRIRHER